MGAVRTFVLAAVACALTVLAMIAAETAGGGIALWFLTGIAIAAIFTLPEAWVGQLAPDGSHGRPFALSALMAWVGLVLAPLTPQILAIEGPGLFILSAAGAVAACVPILLAPAVRLKGKPVVLSAERMGLRLMLRRVPTATLGCAVSGLPGGPVFTFAPLFGSVAIHSTMRLTRSSRGIT
ncbi:hypothetical protein D2T31_20070 [Sinirhodobacter populi]|uniref:MFS transporter n=1 Tax=Paenirhodobacter populi TaxID=2306993 RepID=A0A443K0U9_9RHOB|nr:hypothetical protein [Sinirhodobacter populi]RWR26407.1 hypothetical protein D2T31_20070 [Sinirhodobacter populi]